jgi:hypothetical protein
VIGGLFRRLGSSDTFFQLSVVAIDGEAFLTAPQAIVEESIGESSGGPREVVVSFSMNNVKNIDVIHGTVEVDFQVLSRTPCSKAHFSGFLVCRCMSVGWIQS